VFKDLLDYTIEKYKKKKGFKQMKVLKDEFADSIILNNNIEFFEYFVNMIKTL